jgi:hypothetical protein
MNTEHGDPERDPRRPVTASSGSPDLEATTTPPEVPVDPAVMAAFAAFYGGPPPAWWRSCAGRALRSQMPRSARRRL